MKFLVGMAVGWSIARWMNGQPLVPQQLTAFITPQQLPAPQQVRGFLS